VNRDPLAGGRVSDGVVAEITIASVFDAFLPGPPYLHLPPPSIDPATVTVQLDQLSLGISGPVKVRDVWHPPHGRRRHHLRRQFRVLGADAPEHQLASPVQPRAVDEDPTAPSATHCTCVSPADDAPF